jgi:HlyD family secretion protein
MNRKWIVLLLVIVLLGAGGLVLLNGRGRASPAFAQGGRQAAAAGLRTATVQRGSLAASVEASGSLIPARRQTLVFGTTGKVVRILVEEGDSVAEGALLAELDTVDLELQVKNAEQSLAIQEAALARLQAPPEPEDVASARAALEQAQKNLDKVKAGASAEDLASARATLEQARRNYEEVKAGPSESDRQIAEVDLKKAEASLKKAQAEYDKIAWRGNVGATQQALDLETATLDYQRAKANYDKTMNHPTATELAAALAQVRQAEASLAQLEQSPTAADLAAAEAQVRQAEANLANLLRGPSAEELAQTQAQVEQARIALQQARRRLDDARIVAPFAGVVASIGFAVGDQVGAGGPGIVLVDPSRFHVDVQVDETEVGQIALGQPVLLVADAYPDVTLGGRVTYISDVGQVSQGVVTYIVRVELDPSDLPLRADMSVTATITVAERSDTLLVPTRALRRDTNGDYVEVLQDDGSLSKVYVRVGLSNDTFSEVLNGVREGQEVVIPTLNQTNQAGFGPFGGGR